MPDELLSTSEAARQLGIARASLYDWLAQSRAGTFMIRGQSVTVDFLQGGRRGQGHIKFEPQEVERLKELMRVKPVKSPTPESRRCPRQRRIYPGITVKLGRLNQ